MGFTIEDLMLVSRKPYQMELIAGKNGWSNSIKWLLMVEDTTILQNFTGQELAITTGLGFQTEEKLLELAQILTAHNAAGLVINNGEYIHDIPDTLLAYCDENNLPLMTVPWDIYMSDLVKDMTVRVFLQQNADEQISAGLIRAIEKPTEEDTYKNELRPYFDVDGDYQVVLLTTENLDSMDTVERRRLSYQLQIFLENITHNGNFFYYDSYFVLVTNDVPLKELKEIVTGFLGRCQRRIPDIPIYAGVGSMVKDLSRLHITFKRARSAVTMAMQQKIGLQYFDDMELYRMLYSISDPLLLTEMGEDMLRPLIEYDKAHHNGESVYVDTLQVYLQSGGSIQAVSNQLYTHRNTVIYRLNKIRQMLGSQLDTTQERLPYLIACMILKMRE